MCGFYAYLYNEQTEFYKEIVLPYETQFCYITRKNELE